jgi:nucleotide-binding universal stress UspA family protein
MARFPVLAAGDCRTVSQKANPMTTFLVLTDFSVAARVATQYAGLLARQMRARLVLLHAIPRHSQWLGELDDELMQEARQKLSADKENLAGQGLPAETIHAEVINQFPLDVVARTYAKAIRAGLIVMGMRGLSGNNKLALGSYTREVMENSPVPVIAVPEDAPAAAISRIVYATDLEQLFVETGILVPYARAFGAAVHILHVKPPGDEHTTAADELIAQLQGQTAYDRISFSERTGTDLEAEIHRFAQEREADLLAVFAHRKNIFEKNVFQKPCRGAVQPRPSAGIPVLHLSPLRKPPDLSPDPPHSRMFNRILIPTDFSDQAAAAVRYGVQLLRRMPAARVRFFYASHRPLPTSTPVRRYRALKADLLQEDLGRLEQHVRRVLREARLPYLPQQMELHVKKRLLPRHP